MGRADLHIHTSHSDGLATAEQIMDYVEYKTLLDVIAITDHDQVSGAYAALDWLARRPGARVQVVHGTEVTTQYGRHVLALFFGPPYPERPFRKFRPLAELAEQVLALGGLLVVPHPTTMLVPSLGYRAITRVIAGGAPLAGLEVHNPSPGIRSNARKLRRYNREWGLAEVGSSDAHHLSIVGSAYTTFPGRTVADLERALWDRTTDARWGVPGAVSVLEHARQFFLAMALKPLRERRRARGAGAALQGPAFAEQRGLPAH